MAQRLRPHTGLTACEHGAMCTDDRAGHAVTLMRLRLAHLAPDGWADAIVREAREDGIVELERWLDGAILRVWNHVDLGWALTTGSVVSLHETYGLLAAGSSRFSVAAA
jgi:hypothetical protein